jgi:hypothetical protein
MMKMLRFILIAPVAAIFFAGSVIAQPQGTEGVGGPTPPVNAPGTLQSPAQPPQAGMTQPPPPADKMKKKAVKQKRFLRRPPEPPPMPPKKIKRMVKPPPPQAAPGERGAPAPNPATPGAAAPGKGNQAEGAGKFLGPQPQ